MTLLHIDRSDRRTLELLTERHPDIHDDLSRVLEGLDRALGEKTKQIKHLEKEIEELKEEINDHLNA